MILVLAGTRDGRELAAALTLEGYPVLTTVVSGYGRDLAEADGLAVSGGALDEKGLAEVIGQKGIRLVVDATHPYAAAVSRNAMAACGRLGVRYLRYERPAAPLPAYGRLHRAKDAAEAARCAAGLGKVVFLTTGSRNLRNFKAEPALAGARLIVRVLPDPEVIAQCLGLGFSPRDIVALQGPFSHDLNVALFKEYGSEVVITKNSGLVGGSDSKFSAAAALGLHLVVIDRPAMDYPLAVSSLATVLEYAREVMT
ncbi:MAG TPA: precorrin-6A reductase [Selenomonadales bacterium]|nr:precorrin-6A reductase [Selenomonadales bacterium]